MKVKTTNEIKRMRISSLEASGDVESRKWVALDELKEEIKLVFDNYKKLMKLTLKPEFNKEHLSLLEMVEKRVKQTLEQGGEGK